MKARIKQAIKKLIPFAVTQNQKYDRDTKRIFKKVLKVDSNVIDVGCHKGEVMQEILKVAPKGSHFGVEPIPFLADQLRKTLPENCTVLEFALNSEGEGEAEFVLVTTNPAYSGLKERHYDRKEQTEKIKVKTARLDALIPEALKIDLIKIDVEGGEMGVLRGADKILSVHKPILIFEHGLGASDKYGTQPEDVYDFLNEKMYSISTMKSFLGKKEKLSRNDFSDQFYSGENYYFIAW